MQAFVYNALPGRIIFGSGTLDSVGAELVALGCSRALVLSTPGQHASAIALAQQLGDRCAGVFPEAAMHTPVDVTERGLAAAQACRADALVAIGGGSTIGLAKAIALRTDLPQVVIPTTYAGSEVTPILGETKDGVKTTQRTLNVLPEVVVYDVSLTLSLPPSVTATSGLNAMAHAAEALYAKDANPIINALAQEGLRTLAEALPALSSAPSDIAARSLALYGAWACGVCLGSVGMSLHHKLCHVLGGMFNLPHAATHAIVLPHAMAYNAPAAPQAMALIAASLNAPNAAQGLYDLASGIGAPTSLKTLGLREDQLQPVVTAVCAAPYWNPRPLDADQLLATLHDAWHGRRPAR